MSPEFSDIIAGTLDESGTFPRTIIWTIPDFFKLQKNVGFTVHSPEFSFMHAKCKFAVQPHGYEGLRNIMIIALYGVQKDGTTRWELETRRANDTILRRCTGCKEDGDEVGMSMHIPVKDVEKGCSGQGFVKIVCKLYNANATRYHAEENRNDKCPQTDDITRPDQLSCDMEELMLSEDYYDLTIKVENREFKAHKAVFGVRTPIFMNKFKQYISENNTDVIEIDDCDAATFREFMRYLYASRVTKLCPKVLFPLHKVADTYQVPDLKTHCLEDLKSNISVDNFCDYAVLSLQYKEERLINILVEFFAEYKEEIKKSEKWEKFESENPDETDTLMQKALQHQKQINSNKPNFFQKMIKTIVGGK